MAHLHEKIDFTVTVFVVYQDTVLLRLHEKYHKWLGVGGHIELDEDANAAALRETKEEVGLDVTLVPPPQWKPPPQTDPNNYRELIPPLFINIHRINEVHHHHDFTFVARSTRDAVIPESPTDQWKWCTAEDIKNDPEIEENVRVYALRALEVATTPE